MIVTSVIEYDGEVLPDGSLPVPLDVRQRLAATPHATVRVTIQILTTPQIPAEQLEDAWEAFCQLGQNLDG